MTGRWQFEFSCLQFSCHKRFRSDLHHAPAELQSALPYQRRTNRPGLAVRTFELLIHSDLG